MRYPFLFLALALAASGCDSTAGEDTAPVAPAAGTGAPAAVGPNAAPLPAATAADGPGSAGTIVAGRFGCTRSVYRAADGTYEFQPRGFVEFDGTGGYAYLGFESPSEGRVAADGAVRRFAGGHLDGGEFVPVDDRPGQFTLTAPGIDERWSCRDVAAG